MVDKIERKVNESGLTIIPVTLYFKDGRAKVEIALARGKDRFDKRQTIRAREDAPGGTQDIPNPASNASR